MSDDRFRLVPITAWPVIVEQPQMALSPELEHRVDELWRHERARRGDALHDGRLFSVAQCNPERIEGSFRPYRQWIAQRADPSLVPALGLRPLAVSGLLRVDGKILFGRRGAVTQDAGKWELPPSGGVDGGARDAAGRIDLGRQLTMEFQEELGISAANSRLEPFAMIIDDVDRVIDVAIECIPDPELVGRIAALTGGEGGEYVEFKFVEAQDLAAFCRTGEGAVSAVSRRLLAARGLMAPLSTDP